MQPIGIISVVGSKETHNERLIQHLFGSVQFEPSDGETKIQVWSEPIEVLDQHGLVVKAFVMN